MPNIEFPKSDRLLSTALNYGDCTALSAVLTEVKKEFGTTDVMLAWLGTVFLWRYAMGSPIAGWLGDRFSRTNIVVGSLLAWSAVTALMGLATSYPILLALRVALGVSECLFLPAASVLLFVGYGVFIRRDIARAKADARNAS